MEIIYKQLEVLKKYFEEVRGFGGFHAAYQTERNLKNINEILDITEAAYKAMEIPKEIDSLKREIIKKAKKIKNTEKQKEFLDSSTIPDELAEKNKTLREGIQESKVDVIIFEYDGLKFKKENISEKVLASFCYIFTNLNCLKNETAFLE